MLLVNGWRSVTDFTGRIIWRYARNTALILTGILITGSITLVISEFDTCGHGRVYAVDSLSGENVTRQQTQTGLRGVVDGVHDMQQYSNDTRIISVADTNESVLAGVSGLDRRIIHRENISQGVGKASELGYYAREFVLDNQMSADEYYTLLQIVEAEATGGDLLSKMMVAGVVLNRVEDPHFPDSIYEVVWQEAQFQPTSDGRIYSCSVTESTIEAVERVLQGEDHSQGALFFFARDSAEASNAQWFDSSLTWLFEYGGHEYYTYKNDLDVF